MKRALLILASVWVSAVSAGQVSTYVGNDGRTSADMSRVTLRSPSPSSPPVYRELSSPTVTKTGPDLFLAGSTFIDLTPGGNKAPVSTSTKFTPAAMRAGFAAAVGGPAGVAILLLPPIIDWMSANGVRKTPADATHGEKLEHSQNMQCVHFDCVQYTTGYSNPPVWSGSPEAACQDYAANANSLSSGQYNRFVEVQQSGPVQVCYIRITDSSPDGSFITNVFPTISKRNADILDRVWLPLPLSSIPQQMGKSDPQPNVLPELMRNGGVQPGGSTVTGPSSSPSVTSTSTSQRQETKPGVNGVPVTTTVTTTKDTTTAITLNYDGNKVTTTTTTTEVTTETRKTPKQNPDGSPVLKPDGTPETTDETTTDTKTENPPPKEEDGPDLCEKNPDIIACQKGQATDTPLPPVPDLYTQKYPDGLTGVWNTRKAELSGSSLSQLVSQLMPTVGAGQCPSWMLPLDVGIANFGTHDVSPPCWVWDFGKVVIILSALLLARGLIFGG